MITTFLSDTLGFAVPSIYGFGGILLVLTLQLVPLIFTYLMGAWKTVDVSLLEASESMGCSGIQRAWKIIAPLLLPTVLAGSLLVFVRAFADFGTPMLIGQGFRTVPVLIYSSFVGEVSTSRGFAAAVSVLVIALTLAAFFIQRYFVARRTFSMTAMRTIEARKIRGIGNVVAHAYVYVYLLLAIAPLVVVVASSFRNTMYGQFVEGFSLDSYVRASDDIIKMLRNTLVIGLSALVLLVIISVLVSYLSVRRANALNSSLDAMTMVPYVVPGLVIGIAFVVTFSSGPLKIAGTTTIMVLALMLRRLSYTGQVDLGTPVPTQPEHRRGRHQFGCLQAQDADACCGADACPWHPVRRDPQLGHHHHRAEHDPVPVQQFDADARARHLRHGDPGPARDRRCPGHDLAGDDDRVTDPVHAPSRRQ